MRLRNLSIVSLAFIPTPALATTYVCEACPAGTWGDGTNCNTCSAGTYSTAGSSSCTNCPAGKYASSAGSSSCTNCLTTGVASCSATTGKATSCKAGYGFNSSNGTCTSCAIGRYSTGGASSCGYCSSTNYGAWGGNCGTVTRNVTTYCTKAGSTSSTGNSSTTTKTTTMSCSGHTYCSASTNGTCTSCSKPSNSSWASSSGCGWSCNSGYYKSGNNKCCNKYRYVYSYTKEPGCPTISISCDRDCQMAIRLGLTQGPSGPGDISAYCWVDWHYKKEKTLKYGETFQLSEDTIGKNYIVTSEDFGESVSMRFAGTDSGKKTEGKNLYDKRITTADDVLKYTCNNISHSGPYGSCSDWSFGSYTNNVCS